ncbi:uncharacterized protein LOC131930747 [Physella acuta]|uniref:uncharacterized protein LOC131930747 n=1 Tax=Physella acuta TaxID=109671 RepID=UPI0027DB988C|nr:uncharacterized protein LOC131930747 [Physella acuta]XP_059143332.1 uncharacterized protein LOC131930747 [Physella acuta]
MALCRTGYVCHNVLNNLSLVSVSSFGFSRCHYSNQQSSSTYIISEPKFGHNPALLKIPLQESNVYTTNTFVLKNKKVQPLKQALQLLPSEGVAQKAVAVDHDKEYRCPSRLLGHLTQLVILDKISAVKSFYDCPVANNIIDAVEAPTIKKSEMIEEPGRSSPAKEAKIISIMRIRHKKMKKHKLKKLRHRMYFVWSRQRRAKNAKKMKAYRKELERIKMSGETFDAMDFVQKQLTKARKGGYSINVFESTQ